MSDDSDDESPAAKLAELVETYQHVRETIDTYDMGSEFVSRWSDMNDALSAWQADPENLGKGIDFAQRTALALQDIKIFIPDAVPGPVKDYLTGVFDSIPNYVGALTSLLRAHLQRIDDEAALVGGEVRLRGEGGPTCVGGRVDGAGVRVINSLNTDPDTATQVFRTACAFGLVAALQRHGFGV
jgi:hypothetical protein